MQGDREAIDAARMISDGLLRLIRANRRTNGHPGVTPRAARPRHEACPPAAPTPPNGNGGAGAPETSEPRSLAFQMAMAPTGGINDTDRFCEFTDNLVGDILRGTVDYKAAGRITTAHRSMLKAAELALSKGTPGPDGHCVMPIYQAQGLKAARQSSPVAHEANPQPDPSALSDEDQAAVLLQMLTRAIYTG